MLLQHNIEIKFGLFGLKIIWLIDLVWWRLTLHWHMWMIIHSLGCVFRLLIGFTEDRRIQDWKGYIFAVALLVNALVQSCFFHQQFHIGMTLGMRIKAAVIAAVYKKVSAKLIDTLAKSWVCRLHPIKGKSCGKTFKSLVNLMSLSGSFSVSIEYISVLVSCRLYQASCPCDIWPSVLNWNLLHFNLTLKIRVSITVKVLIRKKGICFRQADMLFDFVVYVFNLTCPNWHCVLCAGPDNEQWSQENIDCRGDCQSDVCGCSAITRHHRLSLDALVCPSTDWTGTIPSVWHYGKCHLCWTGHNDSNVTHQRRHCHQNPKATGCSDEAQRLQDQTHERSIEWCQGLFLNELLIGVKGGC